VGASLHPAAGATPRVNTKLLDALVAEGLVSQADHEACILYAKRRQIHIEEALIQMGLLDEPHLLKFQANFYKTFFVSTKKLSTAPIHESLLKLITHKLAARFCVFPVKFDSRAQELSVLTVQPDDLDMLKNVQFATRVPKVRALVARPAAIQAAIKQHFEGDMEAFAALRATEGASSTLQIDAKKKQTLAYDTQNSPPVSRDTQMSMPPTHESGVGLPPVPARPAGPKRKTIRRTVEGQAPPPHMHNPAPHQGQPMPQPPGPPQPPNQVPVPPNAGPPQMPNPAPNQPPNQAPGMPNVATQMGQPPQQMPGFPGQQSPHQTGAGFGVAGTAPTQLGQPMVQGFPVPQGQMPTPGMPMGMPPADGGEAGPDMRGDMESQVKKAPAGIAVHDYLETLNVLVALMENDRGDLRNHSVTVARICRRVCERLGLTQDESDAIIVAAYLHDIGKTSAYHLTSLNVAEYDAHRQQAKKSYLTPVRIFESVRLPGDVNTVLSHLYERYDGQGFPDRLTGKEICLGSRVLAIVETYADLTGHTGNPFRKKLSSQEAWDVLAKYKGKIFDPGLVDVFKLVVLGDDLRAKLLADSRRALLIDSDPEETTVLELRLAEHSFDVTIARNANEAEAELGNEYDVVISEVDIKPVDGFELLKRARAEGSEVPWVFHSKMSEGDTVQKGFELGADDFITKPASPDLVALKVSRVLDGAGRKKRKTGGVSGSLTEMALPDVVQILFHGRKSGKLTIQSGGKRGEILFSDGMIFDTNFGDLAQEEAFYEMLSLQDGDFELDPNFRPTEQVIQVSPESLLLEGMRRLDESGR
jgi:putative nucleotidyltransferase with HDIG domain